MLESRAEEREPADHPRPAAVQADLRRAGRLGATRAGGPRGRTPAPGVKEVSAGYGDLALVEIPAIDRLSSLCRGYKNLYAETFGSSGSKGRGSETQVILTRRLRAALVALNPGRPPNFRH